MSELPEGWASTNLADIGRWSSGGTPSRGRADYFGQGIPWVKSGDLPDGLILGTEEQITDLGLKNSSAKLMPAGTISMALYGATIGKLGVLTFSAATNQACANVVPDTDVIDPRYVFFYLLSERKNLIDKGQGGAQPNISQEIVKSHPIVLAPINEQRRIVAKLEKLLSRVYAAQVRLAAIPRILKRFRQSVLAAACSGRLTADWREQNPDLESASELLRRIDQMLKQGNKLQKDEQECAGPTEIVGQEIPSTWETTRIRNVCIDSFYGPRFGRDEYVSDGIPTIRTTDMTDSGEIILKDPPRVKVPKDRLEDFKAQKGDLLVTRTGSIGVMAVFKDDYVAIPSAYLIRFRFSPLVSTDYVFHFLKSPRGQNMLGLGTTAVTQPNINAEAIKDLPLPLPPFPEQQEIVRRVEALLKTADALEARYRTAKAHVDKLTQSILSRAFRGELVPQDPNDEPASALLGRISQQKSSL